MCAVSPGRWLRGGPVGTPLLPAAWFTAVDNSRGSKSAEVQRFWEIYDDCLQNMALADASRLDDALCCGLALKLPLLMRVVLTGACYWLEACAWYCAL